MWFVEGPDDMTPCPVVDDCAAEDEDNQMWLVSAPKPGSVTRTVSDLGVEPVSRGSANTSTHKNKRRRVDGKNMRSSSANAVTSAATLKESAAASSSSSSSSSSLSSDADATAEASDLPPLRHIDSSKPVRLALIGATGLVGRACAQHIAQHPEMGYKIAFFVGSALSVDKAMSEVAAEKEGKLKAHYGDEFWQAEEPDPSLSEALVCDVDALLAAGPEQCDVVLSFLAPRFGHLEDTMVSAGFRVVSISPHKRMDHPLVVPAVNGTGVEWSKLRCIKSPNCCSVGSTTALLPLVDMFTVKEISITTFQTLSGRGDALYPAEKVVGNVYPIGATEEKTEIYIANEVARIYSDHPKGKHITPEAIHVSAYRVYVQKNHLLDVRVKVEETLPLGCAESMLAAIYGQVKYAGEVVVTTEVGQPRPKSHVEPNKITVGNFDISPAEGGGSLIRVSVIVDNVAKGAWGNAIDITTAIVNAVNETKKA